MALRKIHYNVMRFRDTLAVDEAEVLAGRFSDTFSRPIEIATEAKVEWITKIIRFMCDITVLKLHDAYRIDWTSTIGNIYLRYS